MDYRSDQPGASQLAFEEEMGQYSQERLPDTQPIEVEPVIADPLPTNCSVWGCLLSLSTNFSSLITITKDQFVFGRQCSLKNDNVEIYEVGEAEMRPENLNVISRLHFVIRRLHDGDVLITDHSSNGTFINSERVGKGMSRPLVHNDEISFGVPIVGFKVMLVREKNDVNVSDVAQKLPKVVTSQYIIGKLIGSGVTSQVYKVYRRSPEYPKFAMKIIRKTSTMASVSEEVRILKRLDHPNIIRVENFFDSNDYYIIIMEAALGGELFDYVIYDFNKSSFDEKSAKLQFYQIVSGVNHMHSRSICHRDLKLENILMKTKNKRGLVKIADFGLSKIIGFNTTLKTYVGTPHYIAPEVLRNGVLSTEHAYSLSADMWSLGCILYSLLCGSAAFTGTTDEDLKLKILLADYTLTHPGLANVSYEALDLVEKLLRVDPRRRLSATGVLVHPWMCDPDIIYEAAQLANEHADYQISRGVRDLTLHSQSPPTTTRKRRSDDDADNDLPPSKRL